MTTRTWIPGVVKKPLPINSARDPKIVPVGAVFHIAVSEASSLEGNFRGRTDGIESTGYIRKDGTIEQYRPVDVECDAQGDGNSFVRDGVRYGFTSWETQGGEFGLWTPSQVRSIKQIITFHAEEHHVQYRLCPAWDEEGFGYHCLFRQWNHNGHTCPGPDRVRQFQSVIQPWMVGKSKESKMNNVEAFKKGVLALAKKYPVPADREVAHNQQADIVAIAKKKPGK